MGQQADIDLTEPVPLFPLPNVVLLPRAILPLHIFEDRYRQMMASALSGDRLIAMALLKSGWEKSYHGRPAIEPVVCVGKILQHELLADGRYNLLLQGVGRARVRSIDDDLPYRRGELEWIEETDVLEIDLADHRRQLKKLFEDGRVGMTDLTRHLMKLFDSPVPTSDLVDVLAFSLLTDVYEKQSLLADGDIVRRVERALAFLARSHPAIPKDAQGRSRTDMN
jgi:uncharacterized protein